MRIILIILATIFGLVEPRAGHACGVCIERPEASLADHILSAEFIVLAGPAIENPFRYGVQEVLKGRWESLGDLPDIPFLIDSVTRRALRLDATRSVLLTYGPDYQESTDRSFSKAWRRIFLVDPERAEFFENLRLAGALWTYGETDTQDRVQFFAEYLWHADTALHNAALIEIGRAPYKLVRPIGDTSTTRQILRDFNDLNRFPYRSVAIRLLGLQTDPQARSIVKARFADVLASGDLHSYEWALAGIEADEEAAINAIGLALQDRQRTSVDRQPLIRALAEAGESQARFKPQIIQIFSEALGMDSDLALQIAIATRQWGSTQLNQQFEALLARADTDPATQFALNLALGTGVATD